MFHTITPVLILVLTSASVLLIVTEYRLPIERRVRQRFNIDRDWWVPVVALTIAFTASIVEPPAIRTAFQEKFDIIVLIFSFGIMAEGLGASGFFRFLAYKIVAICEGNSRRLVLYMFTMTSAVTFFTTNDIVVLVVTPIIVEICFQAGVRNTKPILLSQFVAANTLSMGLLIGSPTNIILAQEVGINFFEYLALMIFPAIVAFASSALLISWIIRLTESESSNLFSGLYIQPEYTMPEQIPEPYFTTQMRNWIVVFFTFVLLVAIVTFVGASLYWCAIPSIIIGLMYWAVSDEHEERITQPIKRLPYGVFFFGMTFFIFAEAFIGSPAVETTLIPTVERFFVDSPVRASFGGLFGSGILVNMFNDLPAAALVSSVLGRIDVGSVVTELVLTQASLVGLNIGTYVTQVGALAGLIWFNQLRIHRKQQRGHFPDLAEEMEFPNRTDLLKYGVMHFVFTGLSVAMFLIFGWVLLSVLLGTF